MPDNSERLDRIEGIIEALATRPADMEDEFRRLLRAQVVMADSLTELAAEVQRRFLETDERFRQTDERFRDTDERFRDTDEKLNALIKIVDGLIHRPPNP